jgi:hypothetical protein
MSRAMKRKIFLPDESYVADLLRAMPQGLTRQQFREQCRLDLNGGYAAEVQEAERRYFKDAK